MMDRTHTQQLDQASRLRQLVRRQRRTCNAVAVVSGKGGVGKSSIAVNMAICLSGQGWRVTLVDVDLGMANADLMLNLRPRYTLADVQTGLRSLEEICLRGPGGIRVVPGASGIHRLADLTEGDRQHLIAELQKLEISTDIVVFDCGAGVSRNVMSFAMAADQVVVVTTPQPPAMTDAYATIKALYREGCESRVGLFVNMAHSRASAMATHQRVAEVARRFLNYSVADFGYMLHDRAVELAVQARCPFVIRDPGSNASACIAAMAREVARQRTGPQRRGGIFRRVAGLFV